MKNKSKYIEVKSDTTTFKNKKGLNLRVKPNTTTFKTSCKIK